MKKILLVFLGLHIGTPSYAKSDANVICKKNTVNRTITAPIVQKFDDEIKLEHRSYGPSLATETVKVFDTKKYKRGCPEEPIFVTTTSIISSSESEFNQLHVIEQIELHIDPLSLERKLKKFSIKERNKNIAGGKKQAEMLKKMSFSFLTSKNGDLLDYNMMIEKGVVSPKTTKNLPPSLVKWYNVISFPKTPIKIGDKNWIDKNFVHPFMRIVVKNKIPDDLQITNNSRVIGKGEVRAKEVLVVKIEATISSKIKVYKISLNGYSFIDIKTGVIVLSELHTIMGLRSKPMEMYTIRNVNLNSLEPINTPQGINVNSIKPSSE